MQEIEFFFDFSSPFAYLAHCALPAIADKYDYALAYRPVDLFEAKRLAGNTGPSTPQIPPKFTYIKKDLQRWAKRYEAPFLFPELPAGQRQVAKAQIDSSRANKAMFFATEQGRAREFATRVWAKTYGGGGLIGDDAILISVAEEMGWVPVALLDFANSDAATALYADQQAQAFARGVFGVPTMMIGEEMWWGNDRLQFLGDFLASANE